SELTFADLEVLNAEARRRHVQFVPIFQSFGYGAQQVEALEHQPPHWLWPFLADDETKGSPLSPPATRSLLQGLRCLTDSVDTHWVHLGGDELGTFGLDHAQSAGIASDGSTHATLAKFLSAWLQRRHRDAMVYADFVLKYPIVMRSLDRSTA